MIEPAGSFARSERTPGRPGGEEGRAGGGSARSTPDPRHDPEMADRGLAAAYLRGERPAVAEVSRWVREAAGRYRYRLEAEWDDLMQDLLLDVTTALADGSFRGDCQLRTYVWRIVHYRCLNRIRDLARRPVGESETRIQSVPDPARPVLHQLLEREREDRLLRFLKTVPEDCRRLWSHILAGRSYREISHEVGVSEGALRVRALRCRRQALARWRTWTERSDG
ncbi:MAG: sigma-70 family RNA polymerase sigma factor [Holophagales bacterium]|nr:sigma-70 family RNA polymerase sigma factor [Holophagales bacterium]